MKGPVHSSRILRLVVGLGIGWLAGGGCASRVEVPRLPEHYEGEAFAPSSFVAEPILVSERFRPPRQRSGGAYARRMEAIIEYVVDEEGRVIAAHIVKTDAPGFAAAALQWMANARFVPGLKSGQPVKVRTQMRWFVETSRTIRITGP